MIRYGIERVKHFLFLGLAMRNDHVGGSNLVVVLETVLNVHEYRLNLAGINLPINGIVGSNVLLIASASPSRVKKNSSLMADETQTLVTESSL